MHELTAFARRNPLAVIGLAAIVGWVAGAGALPLPGVLGNLGRPSTPAPAPATPAAGSGAPARSSPIAASSPAMPGPVTDTDPFAGYGI